MTSSRSRWLMWGSLSASLAWVAVSSKALGAAIAAPVEAATPAIASITILHAIVLGIVQGLTEFLPVSSTGHLIVVSVALGWGTPSVALTALLELGSIAAVIGYFWTDLMQIAKGTIKSIQVQDYRSHECHLALGIGLGTLPIIVLGLLLKLLVPELEQSPLRSLTAIAIASIGMAGLLAIAERLSTHHRDFNAVQMKDGLWMGLAQAMAVFPGISRSGSTLTAGLFLGLDRATAARFSFLLAIPAITLAGLLELVDLVQTGVTTADLLSMIVGGIASAMVSYAAIAWLLNYLQTRTTWIFVWYRLAFGVVILANSAIGWIKS